MDQSTSSHHEEVNIQVHWHIYKYTDAPQVTGSQQHILMQEYLKTEKSTFPLAADLTLTQNVCKNIQRETANQLWEYKVSYYPAPWCIAQSGWI